MTQKGGSLERFQLKLRYDNEEGTMPQSDDSEAQRSRQPRIANRRQEHEHEESMEPMPEGAMKPVSSDGKWETDKTKIRKRYTEVRYDKCDRVVGPWDKAAEHSDW